MHKLLVLLISVFFFSLSHAEYRISKSIPTGFHAKQFILSKNRIEQCNHIAHQLLNINKIKEDQNCNLIEYADKSLDALSWIPLNDNEKIRNVIDSLFSSVKSREHYLEKIKDRKYLIEMADIHWKPSATVKYLVRITTSKCEGGKVDGRNTIYAKSGYDSLKNTKKVRYRGSNLDAIFLKDELIFISNDYRSRNDEGVSLGYKQPMIWISGGPGTCRFMRWDN